MHLQQLHYLISAADSGSINKAAKALLSTLNYTPDDLKNEKIYDLTKRLNKEGVQSLSERLEIGVPTLLDIAQALLKRGRDPRDELPEPVMKSEIKDISELKPGMIMTGTVRNVIDFGAFVDIGVHQDGLVHISQICDKYVRHPLDVLSVGEIVKVKIISVDAEKNRISLTMKGL